MNDLMKNNIYDCSNKIVIVGSCLKSMQPKAFKSGKYSTIDTFMWHLNAISDHTKDTFIFECLKFNLLKFLVLFYY